MTTIIAQKYKGNFYASSFENHKIILDRLKATAECLEKSMQPVTKEHLATDVLKK